MIRTTLATLALLLASSGCAAPRQAPPAATAKRDAQSGRPERHVYRFDFVLSSNDGTAPSPATSFTLNLEEGDKGEVHVGKNVVLQSPSSTGAAPRQDVGLKVGARWNAAGDDVLLEVVTEMSAFEPPTTIRKVVTKGDAVAPAGKPTLVASLDDDHKHYQLMVTPTKLR